MSGTLPNLPDHIEMSVFDVFQIPYSALQPEHEEMLSRAAARRCRGARSAAASRAASAAEDKNWTVQPLGANGPAAQDRWQAAALDELLDNGMTRHEFILRFTLSHPALSSTIVGTSSLEHLRENLEAAARGPLPPDLYAEAKGRLAGA